METKRQRQVAAVVQREMSMILQQEGSFIYGNALVTITRVRMTSDLGIARIYVSVYNAEYKQGIVKELWENLPRLRNSLGQRIRRQVRHIPRIEFYIDDSLDQMEHIDHLFDKLNSGDPMLSAKEARARREDTSNDDVQ